MPVKTIDERASILQRLAPNERRSEVAVRSRQSLAQFLLSLFDEPHTISIERASESECVLAIMRRCTNAKHSSDMQPILCRAPARCRFFVCGAVLGALFCFVNNHTHTRTHTTQVRADCMRLVCVAKIYVVVSGTAWPASCD